MQEYRSLKDVKLPYADFDPEMASSYAKFLKQEILVTEYFANRIQRESKRPVVVIGVAKTGVPYTWSLETNTNIHLDYITYSSSWPDKKQEIQLIKTIDKYKQKLKNPIFIFVDSSVLKKMPSSFTGSLDSMDKLLERNKLNVKLIGYDNSAMNIFSETTTKYNIYGNKLPNIKKIGKNIDVILFNPVKNRGGAIKTAHTNKPFRYFMPVMHDNNPALQSKHFKKYVLNNRK